MAVYEYLCPKCNQEFELKWPISESDNPASCPKCGTTGKKLVSVFSSKAEYNIKGPEKDAFRGTGVKIGPRPGKKAPRRSKKA
ncbi:zinc ribbon domain-containing protein [Chloroflexota bacterium]